MKRFKNIKVKVSSEAESAKVQEVLLGLGFAWPKNTKSVKNTDKPYLYTVGDMIKYGESWTEFSRDPRKILNTNDFANI